MSVGKNIKHDSAITHVTGESIFIDDRAKLSNEVLVGILGCPVSAGKIVKIDYSKALELDGILGIFTGKDFHHNRWGTIVPEQPILVDDQIGYIDEPVCLIAGQSDEVIERAKKLIEIIVEKKKPILSIDEAIASNAILCTATNFVRVGKIVKDWNYGKNMD